MFDDQPELRDAVVVIIHDGDEILFIERARGDTYPGYWSVVTGALEQGENQAAACEREALEEVGLKIRAVRKVWESVTRGAHFVLHWWICELDGPREVRPDASEVGGWQWLRVGELGSLPLMFGDSRWFYGRIYPRVTGKDEG